MAPLHASATPAAGADVNAKLAHDNARDRQFLLKLCRDPRFAEAGATVRTRARQRCGVSLIDARRSTRLGFRPVVDAGFRPRPSRLADHRFRKGGRLTVGGTPRVLKLPLQPIVFTPQTIPFAFGTFQLLAQAIPFVLRAFAQFIDCSWFLIAVECRPLRHAAFMAGSRSLYKYDILDRQPSATRESITKYVRTESVRY